MPGFAYLAVAPTLLVVLLVVGVPLGLQLLLSLHRTNPITQRWIFVGFDNYAAAAEPGLLGGARPHRLFRRRSLVWYDLAGRRWRSC